MIRGFHEFYGKIFSYFEKIGSNQFIEIDILETIWLEWESISHSLYSLDFQNTKMVTIQIFV